MDLAEFENGGNPSNKELLVMTVEIGDGRQDTIAIHENDDPVALAAEFAQKHGLDGSLQQSLIGLIQENKEIIQNKDHQGNDEWAGSLSPGQNYGKNHSKQGKTPKKGTVYDRIYQQLKKNNTSMAQSDLSKSKSSANFNYGEYLYARGLKKKEELKKNAKIKQQAVVDSELSELTFSPHINKNSSVISPRNAEKPEEALIQKKKEYQEKLEKLKEKQDEEALKECKFTPKINPSSNKNRDSEKIHEKLFTQAEKLREKQLKKAEEEKSTYSFKPNVNLTKKKGAKESKEEIFDRLDGTRKLLEEELEKKRKAQEEIVVDEKTGQKFFKPLINSSSEKVKFT